MKWERSGEECAILWGHAYRDAEEHKDPIRVPEQEVGVEVNNLTLANNLDRSVIISTFIANH